MPKKKKIFSSYVEELFKCGSGLKASFKNKSECGADIALEDVIKRLIRLKRSKNKVIFVGNGGSAGICSHQAVDFWKNGNIRATAFNDPSLLTCISNDYGYEYVFSKPIEMFSCKGDMVFAISSSGESPNIINAVKSARKKGGFIVTLSGFEPKNALRKLGDVNFYVGSMSYGIVEITHTAICHSILDHIIERKGL